MVMEIQKGMILKLIATTPGHSAITPVTEDAEVAKVNEESIAFRMLSTERIFLVDNQGNPLGAHPWAIRTNETYQSVQQKIQDMQDERRVKTLQRENPCPIKNPEDE